MGLSRVEKVFMARPCVTTQCKNKTHGNQIANELAT